MAFLIKPIPLPRRALTLVYPIAALLLVVGTLWWLKQASTLPIPFLDPHHVWTKETASAVATPTSRPALPSEYALVPEQPEYCADRYQRKFLENFGKLGVDYCSNTSVSQLHCFHTTTVPGRVDSLCYGTMANFSLAKHKYELSCEVRSLSEEEVEKGVPDVSKLAAYWYDTGPKHVFEKAITFNNEQALLPSPTPASRPISILMKREGLGNLWHFMMELSAVSLTLDTLRSTANPYTGSAFLSEADMENLQVVLLDDHGDGPFFDLWNIFTRRPTIRINQIADLNNTLGDIIVPLAGGGNPFWQGDWEPRPCEASELLRVFANRVMDFCKTRTSPREGDIRVTWINRTGQRRLLDQERLIEAARAQIDHADIQSVDFAGMSMCEQVQVARDTDVLAGVHGAGLTHSLWLRPGSVVAEVQPASIQYEGFRNLAALLGFDYFTVHGSEVNAERRDWHDKNVQIDEEKFISLMESAARSTYKKGLRDFDIV